MKKEYKELYSNITAESELLDNVLNNKYKKKKAPIIIKTTAAVAICISAAILGNHFSSEYSRYGYIPEFNKTVAIADSDDNLPKDSKADSQITLDYDQIGPAQLIVKDITNMTDEEINNIIDEESSKETFIGLSSNFKVYGNALICFEPYGTQYIFNIPNPYDVKNISAAHINDYGTLICTTQDLSFDENNRLIPDDELAENYNELSRQEGDEISLDGDRFARCWELDHETVYDVNGEETCLGGKAFSIFWDMTDKAYKAFSENPTMSLSDIKDTLTFTVEFKNGNKAISTVDVTFDENGNMITDFTDYQYIESTAD